MSAVFTPGPWKYTRDETAMGDEVWGYEVSTPENVSLVYFDADDRPHVEANARLIAAAPELYEALRSAVGAMEVLDHPKGYGALLKAERALAKARGEQVSA